MEYPWVVPGAKVACVHKGPWGETHQRAHPAYPFVVFPVYRQIYTIRGIRDDGALWLAEINNRHIATMSGRELAFRAKWFRPLIVRSQGQDIALFQRIADAAPADMVEA